MATTSKRDYVGIASTIVFIWFSGILFCVIVGNVTKIAAHQLPHDPHGAYESTDSSDYAPYSGAVHD